MKREHRERFIAAARAIAARRGDTPVGPWTALRKLVIQERRDRTRPGHLRVGWKRGEIFEVIEALVRDRAHLGEEWGDLGYYIAQSFTLVWTVYALVTPSRVLDAAVRKFERRARGGV